MRDTLKGILHYNGNLSNPWYITFEDEGGVYDIAVEPGRIDDLKLVGTHLKMGDEVDFWVDKIYEFPYKWAVPVITKVTREEPKPIPTSTIDDHVHIKTVQKKKFSLRVTGFGRDKFEVICDSFDSSDKGYYYFYNRKENGTEYVAYYPIDKTIIQEIENIQVMEQK